MESSRRTIRDGREYDHLFPTPSQKEKTVRKDASVDNTLALIRQTVPETLWHTRGIASRLKGKTLEETCSNIWRFVYSHIQYKKDQDGVEQVRSPRRTWWDRESGVDCDCYTEFISSILLNLRIPHKARITKYPKPRFETPRWQHVYPVVPKDGRLNTDLVDREDYIVIDCVKHAFDDEEPFIERKDYDMRLDYLDGVEDGEQEYDEDEPDYLPAETVDMDDLASVYDDEQIGSIFKKVGKAVKKVTKKVASTAKTVVKKVGDKVGDGLRFINRYANPATILLRNGFLIAMKINLLNVAGRIRYGYLTDEKAKALGMNLDELKKVRSIKDRAETVYWQAGGKKENLKKGILNGKGNKDKKVALSGLAGIDDNVYADLDEYNIIHSDPDNLNGLGEVATGAALAAATSAVAAIAAALKQVKGLFSGGGKEEQSFQSESDNAGDAGSATTTMPEDGDEDAILQEPYDEVTALVQSIPKSNETAESRAVSVAPAVTQPTLPVTASTSRVILDNGQSKSSTNVAPVNSNPSLIEKTTTWIKENPGKTLLVVGALAGGSYLLAKSLKGKGKGGGTPLTGIPFKAKRRHWSRRKGSGKGRVKIMKLKLK